MKTKRVQVLLESGWGVPAGTETRHYFHGVTALCSGLTYGGIRDNRDHNNKRNCEECCRLRQPAQEKCAT
jgi:hypothetical protein